MMRAVCVLLLPCVLALHELPLHARKGRAWQMMREEVGNSDALFWSAKIDHFDPSSSATFEQRYYVDNQYWDGKGPVFLYIGGEGTLSGTPTGYVSVLAQNYSALVVALEHRFYGESIPNGNVFTENLKYLAVDQALADLASFTDFFKESYGTGESKWFAFGGSYPGALASWYRTSYPHHTVGSLSSSGVVNCIADFPEFDEQVTTAVGSRCADQIKRISSAFQRTVESGQEGWDYALDLFFCEKDMWVDDFYYMIADSWSMADQYGAKSSLCSTIMSVGDDADDKTLMTVFANYSLDYWGPTFCTDGFYNTEQLSDPARWETNSRSWRWQTCYEVGWFNTAPISGSLRPLSVNMEYHLKQCAAMFGRPMFPTINELNAKFGGEYPIASNVFYSDFSDDPWLRASVTYSVSSSQPFEMAMCDDCGHCKDLHTPLDSDPQQVKDLRANFETYLWEWLQ